MQLISKRWRLMWLVLVIGALIATRLVLMPRYLVTFDAINFALAVRDFSPALHQPQPPGYPLFVGLLKLLALCMPTIESVFSAAGLIVSAVALILLWKTGEAIGGPICGIVAALLLLFNPAFWLAALTNPVRLCFAAGATGIALCLWNASVRESERWFLVAALALGFVAGFRPGLPVLLAPLVLWTAYRIHLRWRAAALAVVGFMAAVTTWLPSLAAAVGGWRQLAGTLSSYSHSEMDATSILFGAPIPHALAMAWKAIAWSSLGALSWIWAYPVLLRNKRGVFNRFTRQFLWLWFLPGLIFYASFHVGDPDHTLSIVPATCIAGALVLVAVARNLSSRAQLVVFAVPVLLNVFLFFKPITKTTKASTYTPVRWLGDYIADAVDGIGSLRRHGPVTAIFHEQVTGWRQLSYYYPDIRIVTVTTNDAGQTVMRHIQGTQSQAHTSATRIVTVPSCGSLAWVDPAVRPTSNAGAPINSEHPRVFFANAGQGDSFHFHGYTFISNREGCGAETP